MQCPGIQFNYVTFAYYCQIHLHVQLMPWPPSAPSRCVSSHLHTIQHMMHDYSTLGTLHFTFLDLYELIQARMSSIEQIFWKAP